MHSAHPVRVLLADRHTLIRGALRLLLESRCGFVVCEAGHRAQAVAVAGRCRPDVTLLETAADGDFSPDVIPEILEAAGGRARLILVTSVTDPQSHRDAVKLGARGIVSKDCSVETLLTAIQKVRAGELWLERRLVTAIVAGLDGQDADAAARIASLTRREREVVGLLSQGMKNKAIAERLAVSEVTVRHHLTSVFSKLDLPDRLSLAVFAFRHHLMTRPSSSISSAAVNPIAPPRSSAPVMPARFR